MKQQPECCCFEISRLVASDVGATCHHVTVAAAMFGIVHKANERFTIDEDVIASRIRLKGIGAATSGMNARIAFSDSI